MIFLTKIKMFLYFSYIKLLKKLKIIAGQGVYYIGGSETLPPPLTADEELNLLNKLNTEENVKPILIERNLRLVVYIARKFESSGVGVEDLVSIGTIGLIKAINTFKTDKNIKLATYASRCIENEILMYLRRNNRLKMDISLDEPLNTDCDGNELLLSDVLGTESDVTHRNIEDEIDKQLLNSAIGKLSKREKNIMDLRFGLLGEDEKTQKEVADILGISQSYISRLEKRILLRLRKEMIRMM